MYVMHETCRFCQTSSYLHTNSIQKHLNGEAHKKANELEQKRQLGAVGFKEKVVKDTPIGRGFTKMGEKDLETLRICFNSAYCLVKQEPPVSNNSAT